jgi:hypothetical protein
MEKDLSHTFMTAMRRYGHVARIENMIGSGYPDIDYCIRGVAGKVESKWRLNWPKDPDGIVTLDHFTNQQRIWIRDRHRAGGRIYVMLEVEKPLASYLLLPGEWARVRLGITATRRDIEVSALASGVGRFPTDAILEALTD